MRVRVGGFFYDWATGLQVNGSGTPILGTYEPNLTNTGIVKGPLTTLTGNQFLDTPGQVLQNAEVLGNVTPRTSDWAIRNCIIRGTTTMPTGTGGDYGLITTTSASNAGGVIEDVLLDPTMKSPYTNGILGAKYVARRVAIKNCTDAYGAYNLNAPGTDLQIVHEGCFADRMVWWTPDKQTRSDNQTHNDSMQIQGGFNAIGRWSVYTGYFSTEFGSQPVPGPTSTSSIAGSAPPSLSCLLFNQNTTNLGLTGGHSWTDSWFYGGVFAVNCGGAPGANLGTWHRNKFDGGQSLINGVRQTLKFRSDQTWNAGVGTANQNVFFDGSPITVLTNG